MSTDKYVVLGDKNFTNIFWRLGSTSPDERKKAALELNHECSKDSQEENREGPSQNRMQYSLERLSKGLSGSKPEAKLGFSLALTLLLEKLHKRELRSAFETAQSCLFEMVTETKQEGSSKRVGVCLLQFALTRSGAFRKLRLSQKSAIVDQIVPLLENNGLVDLASLALSCAVEQFTLEECSSCLFDKLSTKLSCGWNSLDANGLLLLLCCHRYHREAVSRSFIKSHYATKHLISEDHFDHYLRICWASSENRETMSGAQLHPGVAQLLDCLLAKSSSLLARFVAAAAAAVAASADAPAGRKVVAFNMIGWVADCPDEKFPPAEDGSGGKAECLSECLSSPEVCRQLRLHASSRSSVLNAFACHLLGKRILAASESPAPPSAATFVAVARRLLDADCLFDFGLPNDCRVLQCQRMQRLPVELLDDCAKQVEALLAADTGEVSAKQVAFAIQTLRQLASSRLVLGDRPKASSRMLLCLADRFLPGNGKERPSTISAAIVARSAFCRALDSMSALSEQAAYRRCLRLLSKDLAHRLPEKDAARLCLLRGVELMTALGEEADVKAERQKKKRKLAGTSGDGGPLNWCFALAFVHLGIHLLPGGNEAEAVDSDAEALIADLDECRRRSVDSGGGGGGSGSGSEDGKPRWPDVLLDSFLGLLAASSSGCSRMLRSVASLVAMQVAPIVTLEGVAALRQSLLDTDDRTAVDGGGGEDDDEEEDVEEEEDEQHADNGGGDQSDKESGSSIPDDSASTSSVDSVDPEFRRACKAALGEASCPSDVEDADPSDLSDSAMERVDEALSLAFRSQLGPQSGRRGNAASRAAALESRRRQCQARQRALDVVEALIDGGAQPDCRRALAACLGRLALLAAGAGDGTGSGRVSGATAGDFWASAPAGEREQLRTRAIALLKRAAAVSAAGQQEDAPAAEDADAEIGRTVEVALAANLRTPLPVKIAQTCADTVLAMLRLHPVLLESRLSSALSAQLSHRQRPRIGGLILWRRVLAERPQLLHNGDVSAGIAERMLELLQLPAEGIRSFDRASVASLAACLVKADGGLKGDFYRRLGDWAFDRLATELSGVSSAILLEALLSLTVVLLRLRQRMIVTQQQHQHAATDLPPPPPAGLADRLKSLQPGCHNSDLRRGLKACLTALTAASQQTQGPKADGTQDQARILKRQAKQEKRTERKRLKLEKATSTASPAENGAAANGDDVAETMETD